MPLTYSSFAIAGPGNLGSLIAVELLKQGAQVTALTRGGKSTIPEGVTTKVVDYNKSEELEAALKGIEVVICTLIGAGLNYQAALADAAKAAGVKLFVPGEFGMVSHDIPTDGHLGYKPKTQAHLKKIGLPYTSYYTGLFSDMPLFLFPNFVDKEKKTLANVGSPDVKLTTTTQPDIAHFIAYTLTHLPASKLENTHLDVEGDKLTFREIAAHWDKKYGPTWTPLNRDPAQVEISMKGEGFAAYSDHLFWLANLGYADVGKNDNALVPGWTPLNYEQAMEKAYPATLP